jgi:hypothetical protein
MEAGCTFESLQHGPHPELILLINYESLTLITAVSLKQITTGANVWRTRHRLSILIPKMYSSGKFIQWQFS